MRVRLHVRVGMPTVNGVVEVGRQDEEDAEEEEGPGHQLPPVPARWVAHRICRGQSHPQAVAADAARPPLVASRVVGPEQREQGVGGGVARE